MGGPKPVVLHCGIIGAGIAGLGAAIALSRAGHDVEIYERSTFKKEMGAAITLSPNANMILERWGFDPVKAQETDKDQYRKMQWDTLQCLEKEDYGDVLAEFGHKFNAFHRIDLHNAMRELAESQSSGRTTINLGCAVDEMDCEKGILTLSNGSKISKDLIVVADGIKSNFIEQITGHQCPLIDVFASIYRTLIPMEKIMGDKTAAQLFEGEKSGFAISNGSPSGTRIVTYPCQSDKLLNVAIFNNAEETKQDVDNWHVQRSVADVLQKIEGFHPSWKAIVALADDITVHVAGVRAVIPRSINGRAVLIGDAAHAMTPIFAQGACMGLEDAVAVGHLMSGLTNSDTVEERLQLYETLRRPRYATTQIMSNPLWASKLEAQKEIRQYYTGPIPSVMARGWLRPVREFFFPYDIFEQAQKALDNHEGNGVVKEGVLNYFY